MIVDVLETWWNNKLNSIHTVIPGKIVEYSGHSERKAKVKPLIKLRTAQNQLVEIKPIENVPVVFPGSAECGVLFPLKKDDGVLLLFSESPLGAFLDGTAEVEAEDMTRFSLTDCIAIPGLWSFKNVPSTSVSGDSMVMIHTDGFVEITDTGDINIEGSGDLSIKAGSVEITSDSTTTSIKDSVNTVELSSTGVSINNHLTVGL